MTRTSLALAGGIAAALLLAGCSAGGSSGATSTPAGAASSTTSPASPTSPAATSPTPSGSPTPAATPSSPAATPTPAASASPTTLRAGRCTSDHLTATLTEGDGGAAGSDLPYLVLTNTGKNRCTLQGWPGVSFVGGGNGTQLGAAGDFDRESTHGTVTLEPGGAAHAPLKIGRADNYDAATCDPAAADGLRVYPPGEKASLFVATTGLTACRADAVHLITVRALLPGAA